MDKSINDTAQRVHVSELVAAGRLNEAMDAVEALPAAGDMGSDAAMRADAVRRLRQGYALLCRYTLDGVEDPTRPDMLEDLAQNILDVADSWLWRRQAVDRPTLYFNTVRAHSLRNADTISSLLNHVEDVVAKLGLAQLSGDQNPIDPKTGRPIRYELEQVWLQVFNHVWTTHPLNVDDMGAIAKALQSPTLGQDLKGSLVSALMLGALEWHDERRLLLLADVYEKGNPTLSIMALTGLMAARWRHRKRRLHRMARLRIEALADLLQWEADVRMVGMQLIAARDTERISKKIQEELIPGLKKLSPELRRRARHDGMFDLSSMEENPEWQQMLDKSGLSDKLKELASLQEEGGDVMMASFSNLKSFPFFNEVGNWFLPFTADHTAVIDAAGKRWDAFARLLEGSTFLCDSDKYSLAFAIGMVPEGQLNAFRSQMEAQADALEQERLSSTATGRTEKEDLARNYVRGLYRFFKLFRRKGEFPDPFAEPFAPSEIAEYAPIFGTPEALSLVGEFYFKRGYWQDAEALMSRLAQMNPDAVTLQKIGYARQQSGDLQGACDAYHQSDLLSPDSVWTLKRHAAVLRLLGRYDEALVVLGRLEELRPEDATPPLNRGLCLIALGRFDEALNPLFKAEFMGAIPQRRTARPLAWALTMTGNYDRARQYFEIIEKNNPDPVDRLNRGHLYMLEGDLHAAVDTYACALQNMDFDRTRFLVDFNEDLHLLTARGVDPLTAAIVVDCTLAAAAERGVRI